MKTKLFLLAAVCSLSASVMGQMKIESNGRTLLGGYATNSTGTTTLNLFPKSESDPTRISFKNFSMNSSDDIYLGRYITSGNPSLLHLYGREGFYVSSSEGNIIYYDNANLGAAIYFSNNVDVIGYFYSPSDSRLKKNIKPLKNTISGLKQLSGVSFQLDNSGSSESPTASRLAVKSDNRTRFGFLAQEVKEVYPELVRTDSLGYMYVDYMGMIPLIVNALNEIQARVDSQEIVITQLQQELVALKNGDVETVSPLYKSQRNTASAEPESAIVPTLYQNSPNPFSATTSIRFALPYETVHADLYIYDMQGAQIRRIEIAERGESQITLQGSELSAGMYIYSLIADGKEIDSKRMILTK